MYVIAPISSLRLTSSHTRMSWPIRSTASIHARRSRGACPGLTASEPVGAPTWTLISSIASVFQRPERRRPALEAELRPAGGDALVHGAADLGALRELLDVAVLHARVDERLRAVGPLLGRVLRRIEPGRPRLAEDVDVLDRVAARGHCPDHLVGVRRIDVLVHRDDPLRVIRSAGTLGRERERLSRVAGVTLLERDHRHAPAASGGRMRGDATDAGGAEA